MTKLHTAHQCPMDNLLSLCNMFSLAFQKHIIIIIIFFIFFVMNNLCYRNYVRSPLIDHAIDFPPLI